MEGQRLQLICTVDDLSSEGFVVRRDLTQSERFSRAGKIFAVFFGGAFLMLFVPLLHLILPPLALLMGSVLALGEYAATGEMLEGEITCPNCQREMKLPHEAEEWPRIQRCSGCSFTLTIKPY